MADTSRIKFNPVTREIEIEGTERFVKTYFDKVQKLLADLAAGGGKEDKPRGRGVKKAGKAKPAPAKKGQTRKGGKGKKGDIFNAVLRFITEGKGISTADLMKKTGLDERQVRGVIYRAEKMGRIKKAGRGLYTAA